MLGRVASALGIDAGDEHALGAEAQLLVTQVLKAAQEQPRDDQEEERQCHLGDHEALAQADPEHAEEYEKNLAILCGELDALHEKIAKKLAPYRGQSFYVFHPAFGHFGKTYGLTQRAVEFEGKQPSSRQLRALIQRAKAEQVRIIFVQPQFDRRTAEVVAESIGGATVPIDPLAKDILKNLDEAAREIERSLSS